MQQREIVAFREVNPDDEDDDDQSPPAVFCLDLITLRIDEPLILSAASE